MADMAQAETGSAEPQDRCFGCISTPTVTYEGYFLNGVKHDPSAKLTLVGGLTLTTNWENGMCLGVENFVLPTGELYTGNIDNSQPFGKFVPHGRGKLLSAKEHPVGYEFEGEFVFGKIGTLGSRKLRDGTLYVGSWEGSLYHGSGKLTYPNGDYYEGIFAKGSPHGHGKFVQITPPQVYEGGWKSGKRDGQGIITLGGDEIYKGGFVENLYDGNGKLLLGGGLYYNGEFKKGVPHGGGFVEDATGKAVYRAASFPDQISGRWVNGHKYGVFDHYMPNGEIRTGVWNRELTNYLCIKYADGFSYEGSFITHDITKLHLPEGEGVKQYKHKTLKTFTGDFAEGKPNSLSEGKIEYQDGGEYSGTFSLDSQGLPKPEGFGNMKYKSNGWEYWGQHFDGQRHGYGEMSVRGTDFRLTGKWESGKYITSTLKVDVQKEWPDPKVWATKVPVQVLSFLVEYQPKKVEWSGETKELKPKEVYPYGYGTLTIYRDEQVYAKAFAFWDFYLDSSEAKLRLSSKSKDSFIIDPIDFTLSGPLEECEDLVRIKTDY